MTSTLFGWARERERKKNIHVSRTRREPTSAREREDHSAHATRGQKQTESELWERYTTRPSIAQSSLLSHSRARAAILILRDVTTWPTLPRHSTCTGRWPLSIRPSISLSLARCGSCAPLGESPFCLLPTIYCSSVYRKRGERCTPAPLVLSPRALTWLVFRRTEKERKRTGQ